MTTQHAPQIPPLWRRVLSLPQTPLGWWAVGLAGIALALMAFTNVTGFVNTDHPQLAILGVSGSWGEGVLVPFVFFTWIFLALAGSVYALIALLRGQERSALVWVSMVSGLPALVPLGWIVLVALMSGGVWSLYALAGLAVLAYGVLALIAWQRRHNSGEPR